MPVADPHQSLAKGKDRPNRTETFGVNARQRLEWGQEEPFPARTLNDREAPIPAIRVTGHGGRQPATKDAPPSLDDLIKGWPLVVLILALIVIALAL